MLASLPKSGKKADPLPIHRSLKQWSLLTFNRPSEGLPGNPLFAREIAVDHGFEIDYSPPSRIFPAIFEALWKAVIMKFAAQSFLLIRKLIPAVAALGLLCSTGYSATLTWSGLGGNNNWTTGSNWVGGTAPVPATANDLIFTGTSRPSSTVNSSTTYNLNSITFAAGANTNFTIGGLANSKLSLGSITNSSSYLQTIGNGTSLPTLQFTSGGTIDTGASGLLIRSNMASGGNISKTGSGQLEISNAIANTYSGTMTATAGTILLGANLGLADIIVNSGATLSTAAAGAQVNNLVVSGTLLPGTVADFGSLTVNGNLTLNPSSTSFLAVGETAYDSVLVTGTSTISGALSIAMEYVPAVFAADLSGDAWQLFGFDTANLSGDFATVSMTGTYGNVNFYKVSADRWESQYLGNGQEFAFFTSGANAGVLYAVPEPSTMVFAGIGVAMFGWSTWTRRRAKVRQKAIEGAVA